MSTPLTSPAPDEPSGSSNPISLRFWFKKITEWIAGLSPSGATAYDTGWVDITFQNGWQHYGSTFARCQVRRIGKTVHLKGLARMDPNGGTQTGSVTIASIEAQFRPSEIRMTSQTIGPGNWGTGGSTSANTGPASTGTAHTHTIAHSHQIGSTGSSSRLSIRPEGTIAFDGPSNLTLTAGSYIGMEAVWTVD